MTAICGFLGHNTSRRLTHTAAPGQLRKGRAKLCVGIQLFQPDANLHLPTRPFFFALFHFLSVCKRPGYQRPNGRRRKLRGCEEKLTFRHLARALGSGLLVLGAVPREGPIPGAPSNRSRSRNRSRNRSRSRNMNRNRSSSRLPAPSGGALGAHQRLTRRILSASHSPCGF